PSEGSEADQPGRRPAPEPSPDADPTTVPTGTSVKADDGVSVTLHVDWTVADQDSETIVLYNPNTEGEVTVASGASRPTQTAQDNKSSIDSQLKAKYPDTRACPNTKTTSGTFNGVQGISWTL